MRRSKILIMEDELDVAELVNTHHRVQEYEVCTENLGEVGVRSALQNQPGRVILDIRLPEIDRFEVARRLRIGRRTSSISINFLTEKRDRFYRLMGLEHWAEDNIPKLFHRTA